MAHFLTLKLSVKYKVTAQSFDEAVEQAKAMLCEDLADSDLDVDKLMRDVEVVNDGGQDEDS